MPSLAEIRQQYPQYSDLSDQQLATSLHQKFYADLPFDDFSQKIGLKAAPTTSKASAYMNAISEGMTFGTSAQLGALLQMTEERDLPLSQQSMVNPYPEQLARGKELLAKSRADYPDVFENVQPVVSATMGSMLFPPAAAESATPFISGLLARYGRGVLAAGVGGGAGAGINESAKPGSTPGSIVTASLMGGAQMAGAELGGLGLSGMASKVIAPGIKIPVITPARDKVAEFASQVPGMVKQGADKLVDAMPIGAIRENVSKGLGVLGSTAQKIGKAARSPIVTNAAIPLASVAGGPIVSIPLKILSELINPGAISRYLAKPALSPQAKSLLQQVITTPMREQIRQQ